MSAINVNSITGRTGTHGPVLTGVTTATNGLHVTGGSGNVLIGGTLPSSPNISLNANGSATMTGDLTLPIARATDHMEGVGQTQIASFTNVEQEFNVPTWATRAKIIVGQGFADGSNGQPFECRIKAGSGTNYGTVTDLNNITSWTTSGAITTLSDDPATFPYFRLYGVYSVLGAGQYYTYRATGEIHWRNKTGSTYNINGNWYGAAFTNSNALSPFTMWSNTAGNLGSFPSVISFSTTYSGNTNDVQVIFYA